jgi:hypothetical protein
MTPTVAFAACVELGSATPVPRWHLVGGSNFTASAWPERARSEAADCGISHLQRLQRAQAVPSASLQPSASTFLSTPARSGTFSCNDPAL